MGFGSVGFCEDALRDGASAGEDAFCVSCESSSLLESSSDTLSSPSSLISVDVLFFSRISLNLFTMSSSLSAALPCCSTTDVAVDISIDDGDESIPGDSVDGSDDSVDFSMAFSVVFSVGFSVVFSVDFSVIFSVDRSTGSGGDGSSNVSPGGDIFSSNASLPQHMISRSLDPCGRSE